MTHLAGLDEKEMRAFYFFKGRVALYAILKAMGVTPGDEVILPGFTCVVVPNAVVYLGGKPVYVDIDRNTYNIDPGLIEERITPRTKVIVAQHTFGIPAQMDKIMAIAEKNNLLVIEDSCHAIGSTFQGREVGTFGDAAFFSSQWSKPVTTGLGGWAIINNEKLLLNMHKTYAGFIDPSLKEELLLRLQHLAYSGLFKPSLFWVARDLYRNLSSHGIAIGSSSSEELRCRIPEEYEKKMSRWQRSLLEKKLRGIERINNHRKWVVSLYENGLKASKLRTVDLSAEYEPVFLRYPVLLNDKGSALKEARNKKIELGEWFLSPMHPNLDEWEKVNYVKGMCPNAEYVCDRIVNLPTHEGMGKKEIGQTMNFITNIVKLKYKSNTQL